MRNYGVFIFGLLLVVFGGLGILANYGMIQLSWGQIWPLFLLVPGLLFELGYFLGGQKDPGVLVPGGILTTYGVLFALCVVDSFAWMTVLWPLFILGPAVGLFQLYVFGGRDRSILIPVGILGTISLIFLMVNFLNTDVGGLIFPIILMVIGAVVVLNTLQKNKHQE